MPIDAKELRRLHEAATPGPWKSTDGDVYGPKGEIVCDFVPREMSRRLATILAAACVAAGAAGLAWMVSRIEVRL